MTLSPFLPTSWLTLPHLPDPSHPSLLLGCARNAQGRRCAPFSRSCSHPALPPRSATCCDSDLCNTLNHTATPAASAGILDLLKTATKTCDVVYSMSTTATYADWATTAGWVGSPGAGRQKPGA